MNRLKSFSKIVAVAALTIRTAINSRVFLISVATIAAVIIGLPFVIKGDGTPESIFYIFINYSLGILIMVLSLLATWCGAGAISLEMDNRRMQLLAVKPLRPVEIWTGKLLGLMIMNVVLLVFAGTLLYATLQWSLASAGTSGRDLRREIMTVYRPVTPVKAPGTAYKPVAIDPGQNRQWSFDMPEARTKALVKYRFFPSPFAHQSPVPLTWRASTEKGESLFSNTIASSPHMNLSFRLVKPAATRLLKLECLNAQTSSAVTVFFPSENSLQVEIPESNFETNLARGLFMVLARLCFFTSLGMLAGTMFSFPVASFVSMALLLVVFSGGFVRQLAESGLWIASPGQEHSLPLAVLNEAVRGVFRFIAAVLPPLDRFDPLAFLPNGLLIPIGLSGQALLVLGVLYSSILIVAGALCLSRREVGLPQS